MGDDLEDGQYKGLIDNDPALDCLLYQEMSKESKRPSSSNNNKGCLGSVALIFLPVITALCWYGLK